MDPRYLGLIGKVNWSINELTRLLGRVGSLEINISNGAGGKVTPLFDHYTSIGNVGTTETDLYSDTIVANTLATDGDRLEVIYAGIYTGTISDKNIGVYFADGDILIVPPQSVNDATWQISCTIIRKSSTSAICTAQYHSNDASTFVSTSSGKTSEILNIDFTAGNLIAIKGLSTGGSDEVIAKMGTVTWISHA